MMDKGMIVNPDHMSQAAVDRHARHAEARNYSGVISPARVDGSGQLAADLEARRDGVPRASAAEGYVNEWKAYRPKSTPYLFGWGYGADLGGLSDQPGPAPAAGSPTRSRI